MSAATPAEAKVASPAPRPRALRRRDAFAPAVAILTGGGDRPYAIGLAGSLLGSGIPFDFIGSDDLDSPELHDDPRVRFLNLRGDQNPDAPFGQKIGRILTYYARLIRYATTSRAPIFHILWNNKLEYLDRTLLMLFYRICGKRLVFTAHNVNIRKRDGNDSWLNRWTLRVQYRLVSHILVHTEQMKRELQCDFSVDAAKMSVIPFGINNTVPDTDLTRAEARKRLGLSADEQVALFFGNIAPYKGLEDLVTAFEQLVPANPKLRLVIAGRPKGESSYWQRIQEKIRANGLGSSVVERIEYVPDADTEIYFKAADVVVLPYRHIFQSGVLFLGYNFGLPAIATDVGSLSDDVIEGETGLICKPRDAIDLADCIRKYFSSTLYRQLDLRRREIRNFAQERYSWTKVGEIARSVYQSLLARS